MIFIFLFTPSFDQIHEIGFYFVTCCFNIIVFTCLLDNRIHLLLLVDNRKRSYRLRHGSTFLQFDRIANIVNALMQNLVEEILEIHLTHCVLTD